jgi:hypothetical protein
VVAVPAAIFAQDRKKPPRRNIAHETVKLASQVLVILSAAKDLGIAKDVAFDPNRDSSLRSE